MPTKKQAQCPECKGTGFIPPHTDTCTLCNGTGKIPQELADEFFDLEDPSEYEEVEDDIDWDIGD